MKKGADPIIVALDTGDRKRLLATAESLRGEVEVLKVGLEAFSAMGPEVLDELKRKGFRVFADLKLHDIPNTVQGAIKALVRRGVDMLTVHIAGGRGMLEAAVEAGREEAEKARLQPPLILGVTVLTSLDRKALHEVGITADTREAVVSLAKLGIECGLDGLVASAREVPAIRKELGSEPVIITPGIRLEGADPQDQARTATPDAALRAGADYLVVGRAVVEDPHPAAVLRAIRKAAG